MHLSTNNLQLEPAYVLQVSSQRTFKVRNASEIPVTFSWKQFQDSAEQAGESRDDKVGFRADAAVGRGPSRGGVLKATAVRR